MEEVQIILRLGGVAVDPVRVIQIADVLIGGDISNTDVGSEVGCGQGSGALHEQLLLESSEIILCPVSLEPQILDAGAGVVVGGSYVGLELIDSVVEVVEIALDLLNTDLDLAEILLGDVGAVD